MQVASAWFLLIASLFRRVDLLLVFVGAVFTATALAFVAQAVFFTEARLIQRLQALYPEYFILSHESPVLEGYDFERHLLSRNEDLQVFLSPDSDPLLLPDLRIRSASLAHPAVGMSPGVAQVLVSRPIYHRLLASQIDRDLSLYFEGQDGDLIRFELLLLPLETSERWLVLHPDAASWLKALGSARMQAWFPVVGEASGVNGLAEFEWEATEQGLEFFRWESLLPLSNRLLHKLLVSIAPWLVVFVFTLAGVFIFFYSQVFLDQVRQWLRMAGFFIARPIIVTILVALTAWLLVFLVLAVALALQYYLSLLVVEQLSVEDASLWWSLGSSPLWLLAALPAGFFSFLLVHFSWLQVDQAYWERGF